MTVINMNAHNTWGDRLGFLDWETRRVVGWITPIPKVGDELRGEMKSGGVGRFRVTKVEPCGDPSDMFFADVEDIGYVEEVK